MLSRIEDHLAVFEKRLYELETKLADQDSQLEDVARMGLMITSILDLESVLAAVMEMAVRTVGGEVGCIILQEKGHLATRVSWGVNRDTLSVVRMEGDVDIVDWVMQSGEIAVINDMPNIGNEHVKINSILAAPLISRDTTIGALVVVNKDAEGGFAEEDKLRVEMLVRFAAVAIENANLMKSKLRSQKMEQEMELARSVQQALLPDPTATFEGAIIEAKYVPAGHVGGDYFDIIRLSDHEFVVIVGDVSNKGVPAALMMAAVRSVFRMEAGKNLQMDLMVTDLNTFLCDQVLRSKNMFLSLAYCYFNLNHMTCTYVNAGHLPPIHYQKTSQKVIEWRTGGVVLGQFPGYEYKCETIALESGDKVLLYTDGISESENVRGELFGRARLREFVETNANLNPSQLTELLLKEVDVFRVIDPNVQIDDTTVLVVEIR